MESLENLLDGNDFEDNNGPYTSSPDGTGNHYCLDLVPTSDGTYGQVIRMWHDDTKRSLEAISFKEWITEYKNRLESGQLIYSEEYFGIVDKDEVE